MKATIICILFYMATTCCYGQLSINTEKKLSPDHQSVMEFMKTNQFDYALIAWYTSPWASTEDNFYCLFKQNDAWYLTQLISPSYPNPIIAYKIKVKQTRLKQLQADSLLTVLKTDSAFRYKQDDFTKLPETCSYAKDGKTMERFTIYDAATYHIARLSNHQAASLSSYAPDYFYKQCYPYLPEYGILKDLANTVGYLTTTVQQQYSKK